MKMNKQEKKYSYPCPWCKTRLTTNEAPKRSAHMCAYSHEFFAIDKVNFSTQEMVIVKIDRKVAIKAMEDEKLSSPFNPDPN